MLDIPDVRLGPDPAVSRASIVPSPGSQHRTASTDGAPDLARPGAALVAMGIFLAVFTTVRYQAALVVAADAVLDGRSITGRRSGGSRSPMEPPGRMVPPFDLAPGWRLRLVALGGHPARQPQDTPVVVSRPVEPTWPLVMLLVLPGVMFGTCARTPRHPSFPAAHLEVLGSAKPTAGFRLDRA